MKRYCLLLIIILIAASCASPSNILNLENIKSDERVYIGKFNITFNGQSNENINCELFINSEYKPTFKVSDDGYVFYKSKAEIIKFDQIACQDEKNELESRWYNFDIPYNSIIAPKSDKTITYFGDIKIIWNTSIVDLEGQPLKRSMTTSSSKAFQADIERIHNAGKFRIGVDNNMNKTIADFLKINPDAKKSYNFGQQLLQTGKSLK